MSAEKTSLRGNKSSFLSGVIILTVSNILVKIAGLFFKIPMNHIVGDTGMGYYNSAYSIYTFFYMLSTAGLPVAITVMVSENRSIGNKDGAQRVYKLALLIFSVIGVVSFSLLFFFADELAELIRSDRSAFSVMAAAPTMLFICISSAYRGYFQGCGNMTPTAISQLIEAVGKLVFGIAGAGYAIRFGYPVHIVAAFAVFGLTLGSFLGMIYVVIIKMVRKKRDIKEGSTFINREKTPVGAVLARFIKISLPITVSSSVMSLTNMIDTAMIQRILRNNGIGEEAAATLFGNYTSLAVPMFNLPPVLVYPIAYSLVPVVASSVALRLKEKTETACERAFRYSIIIGLPCALGLSVLADPILCLLYKDSSAHMASPLLSLLAPSSVFICILAVTNSILQGCGKESKTVVSMLCGAVIKCASSAVLLSKIGISGAPVSTFLCYLTVTALNIMYVVKYTGVKIVSRKTFIGPLVSSVLCAGSAYFVNRLMNMFAGESISCITAIAVAAAVYAAALFAFKTVTLSEISEISGLGRKKKKDNKYGTYKRIKKKAVE